MSVTHATVAAGPNDPTKQVSSDPWNEAHTGVIDNTMHGARGAGLHSDSHANTLDHANTNDPTAGQKAALPGTSGAPGAGNPYVTDADARNTNSRTPLAHVLDGALHTVSGLTIGHVLKATGAAAFAFGQLLHSQLGGITATDHHVAPAAGPDADVTIDGAGAAGTASTFARSAHGHQVVTTDAPSGANITIDAAASAAATGAIARAAHGHRMNTSATAAVAIGTAAAGTSGHSPSRDDHVHPTGAGTPSTQAFADAAAVGTGPAAAMTDHKHAMPVDPRPTIAQAAPAQALGTADTYVTNSAITIPAGLRVGTILRWRIFITKTAAGVAAPIIQIRFGTAGSAADTSRVSITGNAQTGVIDSGCFEVVCIVTAIGATGNVLGMIFLNHQLATTGLSLGNWGQQLLSANFDLTVANLKAGISITPGASAAWTVNRVVTQIEP